MTYRANTPTLVLVHGGWGGAWNWEKVSPLLDSRGIVTRTLDLPSVSEAPAQLKDLHDDADWVRAVVDDIQGPVVVCGSSYGGIVITEACGNCPTVRQLIYLAAFMPTETETVRAMIEKYTKLEFSSSITVRDDGTVSINPEALFGDCDSAVREWARAQLEPQSSRIVEQAPRAVAWREIPSVFVSCLQDEAFTTEANALFARRARTVVELDAGHIPQLSRPGDVADLFARLIRQA